MNDLCQTSLEISFISFFKSGILLQQPRAPLEGLSMHFSNNLCIALSSRKWEDGRYSIFLGRRHNSCWTHSPQTRLCNKNGGFWSYFRDFVGAQKVEDLSESKNFFAEVFHIKSKFLLAKNNLGLGAL